MDWSFKRKIKSVIDNESDGNDNDDLVCVKLKVEETKLRRAGEGNLEVLFL